MQVWKKIYYKLLYTFHKITHWEYWPQEVVYFLLYPVYAYYGIKLKPGFFVTANPHDGEMKSMIESKKKIYDLIPQQYYPYTILIEANTDFTIVLNEMQKASISYPCISKPNIGHKGVGVKKVYTEAELKDHHQKSKHPYLVQQLVDYPNEIGLFYVRFPNEDKGKITGIVYKEFLHITGDGHQTLEQLIYNDARTYYQLNYLQKKFKDRFQDIIPIDETVTLVPFGNHVRGSKFLDFSHKITPALTQTFDTICKQINGYYFGRMDIKFDNWQDLEQGKNFAIIETNGAGSEPTHIYDPKHSIFFAWKEILRHLYYLQKVSQQNHERGYQYAGLGELLNMYSSYKNYIKEIE